MCADTKFMPKQPPLRVAFKFASVWFVFYLALTGTRILMRYIILFLSISIGYLYGGETARLIVLHTTDVHGMINPYDYMNDIPAKGGLARVFTIVKQYRRENDKVILVDGGDLLQGTPFSYFFNHIETLPANPLILTMNYMRYDAFTVGNHDIEQGSAVYGAAREQSRFPWLSANAIRSDRECFFQPYTIIEKDGIRIGIIGLTTPAIPMWLQPELYPGIEWPDMVVAAGDWVKKLRPQVHVLIGVFHAGMDETYNQDLTESLGLPNENPSRVIAETVPGFDVILCGHSHRLYPYKQNDPKEINGTLFLMSGSHARYLGVAELILSREENREWKITSRDSRILELDTVQAAAEILTINEPYHRKILEYTHQVIGRCRDTLSARSARWKDTALMQFINQVQLTVSGADISFASVFDDSFILLPGPVQVKDAFGMYKYENTLHAVEMSGQQIRKYLEHAARYYVVSKKTGRVKANPDLSGYNYDMAEGIGYEIDVRAEPGRRIKNLINLKNGRPLEMQKIYRVALNSYRTSGGGGYLTAAGISKTQIIWKSSAGIRDLLIDAIREQSEINIKTDGNWKLTGL
jgi:2',3'-cyclic-nucleotide 2'-phosphodiesterase / 3'-nucleotidase